MDQQSKNIMSSEGNAPNRSYTTNTSGKERQVDDYTGNDHGKDYCTNDIEEKHFA